jgi:hypothetical protein
MKRLFTIGGLCLATLDAAWAGKADVIDVKPSIERPGVYRFDVTVRSDDKGWHKYADKFDVVAPDGRVLGSRVLLHPHEDEQPFTRELDGVAVPAGLTEVIVRAHDKVEGYGGKEFTVKLPQ